MEQFAYILIALCFLLLIIIIALLTLLIFKLFKGSHPSTPSPNQSGPEGSENRLHQNEFHPAIIDRMNEMKKIKQKRQDLFCPNHPEEPGETVCAICDQLFCKACIKDYKSLHFCKEHLPLIMNHDWDQVITVKTSGHDPELGVRLYEVKKEFYTKESITTYIETHYKINVDQDFIETYLVVYAIKDQIEKIKEKIEISLKLK